MFVTKLIQFAIEQEWKSRKKVGCCPITATHRGDIYITTKETDTIINSISNTSVMKVQSISKNVDQHVDFVSKKHKVSQEEDVSTPHKVTKKDDNQMTDEVNNKIDAQSNGKIHQEIDILIWFPTIKDKLGNCILSNVKYKLNDCDDVV
jgi:hypothetical protein